MDVSELYIEEKKRKIQSLSLDKNVVLLVFVIMAVLAKVFLMYILPGKYLYDSQNIINLCNGNGWINPAKGYSFSMHFYNFLVWSCDIYDANKGSILIGLISNLILIFFFYIKLPKNLDIKNVLYLSIIVFLLNVYVFNISKDFIQLLIDLLLILVLTKVKNKHISLFISVLILLFFGYFFRVYLNLIALVFILLVVLNNLFNDKRMVVVMGFVLFIIITFILYYGFYSLFNDIFNSRELTNAYRIDSEDANTIIANAIPGNNYFAEIINYLINLFRMILPIELLFKGNALYIFFFIFIIYSFLIVFKKMGTIKTNYRLSNLFFFFLACVLISVLFEPDFGSYLRHFVVYAFVSITAFILSPMEKCKVEENL